MDVGRERGVGGLQDAVDNIVVGLAGDASVRVAWALRFIEPEQVGFREASAEELGVDETTALVSTPAEAAARFGSGTGCAGDDRSGALALAKEVTRTTLEAHLLFSFCETRTANDVAEAGFQRLAGCIVPPLLDNGVLDGALAMELLARQKWIIEARQEGGESA